MTTCRFCDKPIRLDSVTHTYVPAGARGAVVVWCSSSQDGKHRPGAQNAVGPS